MRYVGTKGAGMAGLLATGRSVLKQPSPDAVRGASGISFVRQLLTQHC